MPGPGKRKEKKDKKKIKKDHFKKLYETLGKYKTIVVISVMNVSASQIQLLRFNLRKKNSIMMVLKNSIVRKAIEMKSRKLDENFEHYDEFKKFGEPIPELDKIQDLLKGKVALVFTDEPVSELKPIIEANRVTRLAKIGQAAQHDVVVPAGPTGLEPSQVSFFHALQISTKIKNTQIEILKDVKVCDKGKPVTTSQSVLLKKLDIKPFSYGCEVLGAYDNGCILSSEVIALSTNDLLDKFKQGLTFFKALSVQTGMPNEASIPYLMLNAFKNIAAISTVSDYKIKQLENMAKANEVKKEESKGKEDKKEVAKKEEVKEEIKAEEVDMNMGDLFA